MRREWIEDLLQRYWREGNRVVRVLAVALLILLALLLTLRWLRVLRLLAAPVLIGAILIVGWLLLGPLLTIPRFSPGGPVVRNGVAAVVVCGKKAGTAQSGLLRGFKGFKGLDAAMKYVPEPRTGTWWPEDRGDCTTWYHRPPDATQRFNRHERAAQEASSGAVN